MSEWREVALGELVTFENGDRSSNYPKTVDNDPSGIPFVSASNISESGIDLDSVRRISSGAFGRLRSGKLMEGDLIYCLRGTIGKIARVPPGLPGAIASSLVILRAENEFLNGFVYYFLKSAKGQSEAIALNNGSAQPNLSVRLLSRLTLNLPPKSEIVQIVTLLKALDDKIELNRRTNETLEALARVIFKDWFVEFGPTHTKAEGRAPYLATELWDLFPDALNDEDKPVGWSEEPVRAQAQWVNGAAYKNMHFTDAPDALPVIKITELKAGVTKNTKFTNTALGEKYRISDGELLFSWSGNPDTSIDTFIWTGGDAWLNQHIFAVRQDGRKSTAFLYFMLKWLNPEFAEIARNKQTTGLGHVTQQDLKRLTVCTGTSDILAAFDEIGDPIYSLIYSNLMENGRLAQTRDFLLPRLMSREIRLREAVKMVEAVA